MDASFGLGQSKQTDENQQQGERARQRTWGKYGLQRTIPRLGKTKGAEPFLRNDSDSSRPSRQRRAVTSHTASVKQTNKK